MILVTGGLGMIGAHTARALADLGHDVLVTTHHRAEVPSWLEGRVTVEPLDVTDRAAFLALADRHAVSDIVHLAAVWGPLVDPESPFFHIPSYISAVLRGEQPPRLYGSDGGDRCYAPDAGRAIALLMTAPTLRHDTYNVSSGVPSTNRDFAAGLESAIPRLRLDLHPGREHGSGEDPYLDIARLTADTGFTPAFDVRAAVADYVAWRAANPR
nr:hypothetical protein GCM10020063_048340 [Dactylosporangium thailandense]